MIVTEATAEAGAATTTIAVAAPNSKTLLQCLFEISKNLNEKKNAECYNTWALHEMPVARKNHIIKVEN